MWVVILNSPIRFACVAFGAHSRYVISPFSWTLKPYFSQPLLNFSRPPSVSSIVFIHFCAWLYLLLRASLNGESQGSNWTTAETVRYPGSIGIGYGFVPVPSSGWLAILTRPWLYEYKRALWNRRICLQARAKPVREEDSQTCNQQVSALCTTADSWK